MVWQMSVDQVLSGTVTEDREQGLITGRPLAILSATLPGIFRALVIALFLNLACELSMLVVSIYRHFSEHPEASHS